MTTPAPSEPWLNAPTLVGTGVDAMAQNAGRLGVTWGMTLATVLVGNTDSSNNVTVITDGDLVQMLTMPLVKRRPVYNSDETPRTLQPGDRVYVLSSPTGLFATPVSPDQEVTNNLLLYDNFDRPPETGGWGTPTYGPPWTPSSGLSTIVGSAQFGTSGTRLTFAGFTTPPTNVSVYLVNVRTVTVSFSITQELKVNMRGTNVLSQITYPSVDALPRVHQTATGDGQRSVTPILGATSSTTPVDLYVTVLGGNVNTWGAITSNGINITAPQSFPGFTTFLSSGTVSLSWNGNTVLRIGTIVIRSL